MSDYPVIVREEVIVMAENDDSTEHEFDVAHVAHVAHFADALFEAFVNLQKLQYAHLLEKERQNG